MTSPIDISGIELYGYLGLQKYASETEVKKAYRKLALKLHPDKNPGRKDAAENFQKLQKIFETLTDITKKGEYDQKLKAMEKREKRLQEMDAKTQYFKKRSDEKNKEYQEKKENEERQRMEKESLIRRMREEGRRKLREEELEREKQAKKFCSMSRDNDGYSVKVSWKTKKGMEPAYSEEEIKEIFSKFGEILHVIKSKKKEGRYLINYATRESAVLSTTEIGKPSYPFTTELSFENRETSTADNVQAKTEAQSISFDDLLRKYGINPNASADFRNATEKPESKQEDIDKETGLPIKYVYSHGTDTVFACAATFSLPPEIRLRGTEEVVYGGFVVRLWPTEQVKYAAPND